MAERLAQGLRRVRADNPGPLTGPGTNSYILGEGAVAVIDPGPEDARHLAALEAALARGERISHVVVTHAHVDHSRLARPLAARWQAPVLAFGAAAAQRPPAFEGLGGGEGVDTEFAPDIRLTDGATIEGDGWRLTALWTPGHMGDHLCLLWGEAAFSGDHVMGWASTVVSPPDGDMAAYMASLDKLAAASPRILFPGHGDPVADPAARIAELRAHRRGREAAILSHLGAAPQDIGTLTRAIYTETPATLLAAAERNVLAHLLDLCARGAAVSDGPAGPHALFRRG